MKRIIQLCVFLCAALSMQAQTRLNEGKVDISVSYPDLSGEMKQMESMLPHEMTMYFKDKKSRVEMQGLAMGKIVTLSDAGTGELIMMMDMGGKKMAVKQSPEDRKKQQDGMAQNVKVTKVSGTKTIAGYPCKKALIEYTQDGETIKSECYYTDLLPKTNDQNDLYFKDIDGFMMEYSISQAGMKMKMTATAVKAQKVPDTIFNLEEGYEIMSEQELQKLMGQ
jgi:hypothetical protein